MKKILALLILAVFVAAIIPVALAEDLTIAGNSIVKDKKEGLKAKAGEMKQLNAERRDIKDVAKEAIKGIKEKSQEVKEQLREKIKDCKAQNDSSQCNEIKSQLKTNVKDRLLVTSDEMLALMNNLKQKIEALNLADKADLETDIDVDIAKVTATKDKINALTETATKDDYKVLAKELQDEWKDAKVKIRVHATRMLAIGFERVLDKAEKLEAKLDSTLAKLKEKGFDTSKADVKVAEFKVHVADSRKSYDEANVLLQQYRADPTKENAVQAVQEKMKEAKKDLQEAQQSLKEAVKAIKSQKDGAKILADETAANTTTQAAI